MKRLHILILMLTAIGCSSNDSPNNEGTPAGPVTIQIGVVHNAEIGDDGESYYKFIVVDSNTYAISLTHTQSDLGVELYRDLAGTQYVGDADDYFTAHDELMTASLIPGTYYLVVDEYDGTGQKFQLLVDLD